MTTSEPSAVTSKKTELRIARLRDSVLIPKGEDETLSEHTKHYVSFSYCICYL
ncbi:hypothetical protein Plhal710r2_c009g0043801 [Plasmopara halstedii]